MEIDSEPPIPMRKGVSIIDCCSSFMSPTDAVTTRSAGGESNGKEKHHITIEQMNFLLHTMEAKFEQSLIQAQTEWEKKYDSYDKTISLLKGDLSEAKIYRQQHDVKAEAEHIIILAEVDDDENSIDNTKGNIENELPHNLRFNTDLLRSKEHSSTENDVTNSSSIDHSNQLSSSDEDTTLTVASIQKIVRKELESYIQEALIDRDQQIDLLQKEIQRQNQLIVKYEHDVLSRVREIRFQQIQNDLAETASRTNFTKLYANENEIEMEGVCDQSVEQLSVSSNAVLKPENRSVVHNNENSLALLTRENCIDLIQDESYRLMKVWGTQFDDLTIYMQDNLDNQQACIAEVRTSAMEHIDSENNAKMKIWNTQIEYLLRKNREQATILLELRDDHERSFRIIVETLIKLKTKFHGIGDAMKEYETKHTSSEIAVQTVSQEFYHESKTWNSQFHTCKDKLNQMEDTIKHIEKEVAIVLEDRDSIQTILSATIELFNAKWERNNDLWHSELDAVEQRLTEKIESSHLHVQNLDNHRREMEDVLTAICKKLVKHSSNTDDKYRIDTDHQNNNALDEKRSYIRFDDVHLRSQCSKKNKKKYKTALYTARQEHLKDLGQEKRENLVNFYDLSLAATASDE